MYFVYVKKTGEYKHFASTPPEDPELGYTAMVIDFIYDDSGRITEVPFWTGASWIFKPFFGVIRPTEVYTEGD